MAVTTTQRMLTISAIVSGDAYLGDPQMALMINGQQVGTADVTASHGNGQWQTLTFNVAAPADLQTIGINFLNDAYGGWSGADRNLYVDNIVANGVNLNPDQGWFQDPSNQTSAGSPSLYGAGTLNWGGGLLGSAVTTNPPPVPTPTPASN